MVMMLLLLLLLVADVKVLLLPSTLPLADAVAALMIHVRMVEVFVVAVVEDADADDAQ